MNKIVKKEIDFGGKKLILETGELAIRAGMAVKATYGDTVVLLTVCASPAQDGADFLGLRVQYEEKLYASGSIKTSRFVKRDGRPTDEAIIAQRAIDHAIRPLFPQDFLDEVQVVATVLSLDDTSDAEFLSLVASSAALQASNVPFFGPISSARIGYINNEFILSPNKDDLEEKSDLNMLVSFVGEDQRFLALEAGASILPEQVILDAINFARKESKAILDLVKDFAGELNPTNQKNSYKPVKSSDEAMEKVGSFAQEKIENMIRSGVDKFEMDAKRYQIIDETIEKFAEELGSSEIKKVLDDIEKDFLRKMFLEEGKRIDGRDKSTVRPISSQISVLPRTHGSALFTRGQTQVLTIATLGSPSMEMLIQDMYGEKTKRFMHFYNFPSFSVGEVGRFGSARPREIGHGMIAEKALKPVIPTQNDFPYTIILVSETISSNGSSSMASTCGSTLALMDAGVPIKATVGGIAMGLIAEDETFAKYGFLTDLSGEEDSCGYLDYKMAGTKDGITSIQCDMKVRGIPIELLPELFEQSKKARLFVIDEMEKTINSPKENLSQYAPKMISMNIPVDKIGAVIGQGGKVIKSLQEEYGVEINIEDDGKVVISTSDVEKAEKAKETIEILVHDVKIGQIFDGEVKEILDFGALVEVVPGKVGLLHVSEIADTYVERVDEYLKVGDTVKVKVIKTSHDGKFSLSKKALEREETQQ